MPRGLAVRHNSTSRARWLTTAGALLTLVLLELAGGVASAQSAPGGPVGSASDDEWRRAFGQSPAPDAGMKKKSDRPVGTTDDAEWRRVFGDGVKREDGPRRDESGRKAEAAAEEKPKEAPPASEPPPSTGASAAPAAREETSAPVEEAPVEEERKDPYVAFYEWATESLQGYVLLRDIFHVHVDDEFDRTHRRSRHEAEARVQYKRRLVDPISIIAEVDFRVDDDNYRDEVFQRIFKSQELRPIINWNDLYLLASLGDLDLRAGFQTIGWGTGDIENPTDNINPRDFTDLFFPRKIGVMALRADYYLEDFQLQGIYVPFFIASRIPPDGKRFSRPDPDFSALPIPVEFTSDQNYPYFPHESQYAAKISRSIAGFDLSASFYSGLNKIPVAEIFATEIPGAPPSVRVLTELRYERINVYGFDVATTLGWAPLPDFLKKLQLHAEGAYVDSQRGTGDDYVRFIFGLNYTFTNVISDHDVTVLFEWVDESEIRFRRRTGVERFTDGLSAPLAAAVQPFLQRLADEVTEATTLARQTRGSFEARITYKFSESLRIDVTGVFTVRSQESTYVRPELVFDMTDNVQLSAGMDFFEGRDDSFFGRFDADDRFFATLKVSF